jgi:hypothetical protein
MGSPLSSGTKLSRYEIRSLKQASWQQAAKYFGGATALLNKIGFQVSAQDLEKQQRSLVILRGELGEERFRAAWINGQEKTMEEWLTDLFLSQESA